jgi:hypothetical protein
MALSLAECACGVVYPIDFPIRPAATAAKAEAQQQQLLALVFVFIPGRLLVTLI